MTAPAVRFDGVERRYGDIVALAGISLEIAAGRFVALVGTSGSGKSTLLKTVNRLVAPDAGRVLIDGRDVADGSASDLRRGIGYVFQDVGLFPHLTVAENIAMVPRLQGETKDTAALLDLVGLPAELALRLPAALSGGQRQRVGVARALAGGAKLMLMDEPFGALDPVTRDRLGAAYRALHDRLGLTTLMVTHDMAEALLLADRVLVLSAGRVIADEAPDAILRRQIAPEARALLDVALGQAERIAALR